MQFRLTHNKLCFILFTASGFLLLLSSNILKSRYSSRHSFKIGLQKRFVNRNDNSSAVLCSWFTTFKDEASRHHIHLNALHNWAKFIPLMQPVLFSSESTRQFDSIARQLGWHVYQIPRVNDNGTPYISDMLDVIMNNGTYNSVFYGFANGDILFDTSLPETLKALVDRKNALPQAPVLVTGQRTNYKMSDNWTQPITDFYYIEQLRARGKLFQTDAEDYFLFTPDFPRSLFKELVIGRIAYDNYIVAMGIKLNVSVVDVTKTVTALHQQSSNESEFAGHHNKDKEHNSKVIGQFDYHQGHTSNAQYETVFDLDELQIDIRLRKIVYSMHFNIYYLTIFLLSCLSGLILYKMYKRYNCIALSYRVAQVRKN